MEAKGYLHQIHPVLPVNDVVEAFDFYVNRLGFEIGFAGASKNSNYPVFQKSYRNNRVMAS